MYTRLAARFLGVLMVCPAINCQISGRPFIVNATSPPADRGTHMGLIAYGPLAAELSGSIGGVTFARAHSQKTVRQRARPITHRTYWQNWFRKFTAEASQRWFSALTSPQRTDWATYANSIPLTNALGQTYYLSGFNAFIRGWVLQRMSYTAPQDTAPVTPGFPDETAYTLQLDQTSGVLSLTGIAPPAPDGFWTNFAYRQLQRSSIATSTSPLKGIISVAGTPGLPLTLATYAAPLPHAAGGDSAPIHIYWIDATRRISTRRFVLIPSTT